MLDLFFFIGEDYAWSLLNPIFIILVFFYFETWNFVNKGHQNFNEMCVVICLCLALDTTKMTNPPPQSKGAAVYISGLQNHSV